MLRFGCVKTMSQQLSCLAGAEGGSLPLQLCGGQAAWPHLRKGHQQAQEVLHRQVARPALPLLPACLPSCQLYNTSHGSGAYPGSLEQFYTCQGVEERYNMLHTSLAQR